MKLGEAMYKAEQATGGAGAPGAQAGHGADEDVIDADFKEVKDDKKDA